jgi:hypothetical protein
MDNDDWPPAPGPGWYLPCTSSLSSPTTKLAHTEQQYNLRHPVRVRTVVLVTLTHHKKGRRHPYATPASGRVLHFELPPFSNKKTFILNFCLKKCTFILSMHFKVVAKIISLSWHWN